MRLRSLAATATAAVTANGLTATAVQRDPNALMIITSQQLNGIHIVQSSVQLPSPLKGISQTRSLDFHVDLHVNSLSYHRIVTKFHHAVRRYETALLTLLRPATLMDLLLAGNYVALHRVTVTNVMDGYEPGFDFCRNPVDYFIDLARHVVYWLNMNYKAIELMQFQQPLNKQMMKNLTDDVVHLKAALAVSLSLFFTRTFPAVDWIVLCVDVRCWTI